MAAILCSAPCDFLGQACSSTCNAVAAVCSEFSTFLTKDFSCFLLTCLALNAIPAIYGMDATLFGGCTSRHAWWIAMQSGVMVCHCIFGLYCFRYFQRQADPEPGNGEPSRIAQLRHLVCYDTWTAAYLLVWIFEFVWLSLGGSWNSQVDSVSCRDSLSLLHMMGIVYLFVGGAAFACAIGVQACISIPTMFMRTPQGRAAYEAVRMQPPGSNGHLDPQIVVTK